MKTLKAQSATNKNSSSHETSASRHVGLLLALVVFGVFFASMSSKITKALLVQENMGINNSPPNAVDSTRTLVVPVSQLTRSHIQDGVKCPWPLVPLYDRIVDPSPTSDKTNDPKIPKSIHLAWTRGFSTEQSRCISQDMMEIPTRWMEQFPSYNLYFHDDEAVDALFAQEWPEFPQLTQIMDACVWFGGAMRIDLWRILVLYRYGGFYSDFDMAPGPSLSESTMDANDTAFFLSDDWSRPSQWLFGLEAKHPIAHYTMHEIFKRLLALNDVSEVKLVFLTGPDALKFGYWNGLNQTLETYDKAFDVGNHTGKYGKTIRKLNTSPEMVFQQNKLLEKVPYPRNSTSGTMMMTVKQRILKEMQTVHWLQATKRTRGIPKRSCVELLYMNNNNMPDGKVNKYLMGHSTTAKLTRLHV